MLDIVIYSNAGFKSAEKIATAILNMSEIHSLSISIQSVGAPSTTIANMNSGDNLMILCIEKEPTDKFKHHWSNLSDFIHTFKKRLVIITDHASVQARTDENLIKGLYPLSLVGLEKAF